MSDRIGTILHRLGLDRQGKARRKRDLDAAQRLFMHCAQGALREAGRKGADGVRDPRAKLYEQIEARLAAAGVGAVSDLPEAEVAELAFQEQAILSSDAVFDAFLSGLDNDDRAYARHMRETWLKEAVAFRDAGSVG